MINEHVLYVKQEKDMSEKKTSENWYSLRGKNIYLCELSIQKTLQSTRFAPVTIDKLK